MLSLSTKLNTQLQLFMQANESGVDRKIGFLVMGKKVIGQLYLTMFENCYISSYWNCISYKKADLSFQILHRGQKRL